MREHIVARVAPIAARIQVPQIQAALESRGNARQPPGDLARHEGLATDRRLVVEEDPVAGIDAIPLAVIDRDPVRVELRHAVR